MQNKFKVWQPHLIALGLFILIPLIYFWPAVEGKALSQSDITNFLGVTREIFDFRAKYHREPLWTNSMFGGMPAFQVSMKSPGNLMIWVYSIFTNLLPFPTSTVFLSCLCFYILMLVLEVDPFVGIIGSFGYAFSSFFFIILTAGHNSEANTSAFMPLVLAGVIMAFKGKRLAGSVITALGMGMEMFAGHIQVVYYLFMALGVYFLAQFVVAIMQKQMGGYFKTVGMLAIGVVLGVGTNTTSLWLTNEYAKYSSRGKSELTLHQENKSSGLTKDYATMWSYGVGETFTFLIPNYKGGGSEPLGSEENRWTLKGVNSEVADNAAQMYAYFGDQPFTSGPVYVGAIMCFFAIMGMFLVKGVMKWFLVVTTFMAIILSWGKNAAPIIGTSIYDLFFNHFPLFNNFRAVSMILVIAEMTIPILAVLAIDKIVKDKNFMKESIPFRFLKNMNGKKVFFTSLAIVGGFALICYILPDTVNSFQKADEYTEMTQGFKRSYPNASDQQLQSTIDEIINIGATARKKLFTSDAGRTLIFVLLTGGLVWVYSSMKKITHGWFVGVLLFFVVWDMSQVNWRYLNHSKELWKTKQAVQVPYEPDQADQVIMQDTSLDYRVFNTTQDVDKDSRTSYFHKSIGGYSGVKMKRYDELMSYQIDRGNMDVLDMLNTKYFIVQSKEGRMPQKNPNALGNAWFVNSWRLVPNADSEITALSHFNPRYEAIVDARFSDYFKGLSPANDSTSSIKMKSYVANDLVYSSHSSTEQLAVFSEIYYKDGWDAFIDDKPADYIRANYVLRALRVPAGNHTIEWKFEPKHYAMGEKISLASSLIVLGSCLGLLFVQIRKKPEEKE